MPKIRWSGFSPLCWSTSIRICVLVQPMSPNQGPNIIMRYVSDMFLRTIAGLIFANRWRYTSGDWMAGNCGWNTHAVSMHKICALCATPMAHTYDLCIAVLWSAEKQTKKSVKNGNDLPKQRAFSGATFFVCFYGSQNVDFFLILLMDRVLIFLAD